MKKNREWIILLAVVAVSLLISAETVPETPIMSAEDTVFVADTVSVFDDVEKDSVLYSADSIYYDVVEEVIYLSKNAELIYHNSSIKAPEIIIDLKENQAHTKGETWMQDSGQLLVGNSVSYDLDTQQGIIYHGASSLEKGFYYGEEIRKVGDDVYDIDRGYFTTCDTEEPNFYIYSGKMRLFYRDKIVAKPVIFYVNYFPILWFPFGSFPVKTDRQSGILVPEPGYNNVDGRYIENIALYYHYNDYAEVLTALDWREKTGWEARLESNYIKRYHYQGSLLARLQHRIMNEDTARREWYIRLRHRHDFLDRSSLDANLEFMSSRTIWEGSVEADERLSERVTSTIAYSKPLKHTTINTGATYVDNLTEDTKRITLPTASYSLPSRPIYQIFQSGRADGYLWEDFYYSYSMRAVHEGFINKPSPSLAEILYKNVRDDDGNYLARHNAGVRQNIGVSFNRTFRGWLNFSQSISGREVWFDRDTEGNSPSRAFEYNTNTRLSHSIYGIGSYPDLPITAIRHVMTPSISFNFTPDYSERAEKYYSFGGIGVGSAPKRRNLSFGLGHKWSIKYRLAKDEDEHSLNDFLTLSSSINYDLEKDEKPFSDISHTSNFRPGRFSLAGIALNYTASLSARQDAYNFNLLNWRINNSLRISGEAPYYEYFPKKRNQFYTSPGLADGFADTLYVSPSDDADRLASDFTNLSSTHPWNINISHDYSRVMETKNTTQNIRPSLSFKLTKNWSVNYSNYYNIEKDELVSQSLSIDRDLECWRLTFTWSKQGDYWHYRLLFYNIQLPDVLRIRRTEYKR